MERFPATHVGVVGVVDDDPAVRSSLKFSLEIEGFAVDIYASAADLLRQKDLSRFSCLVIDQNMPGLKGLDLVAKLREQPNTIPVILITTHPSRALIARAQEAQVGIVEKPLLGNVLVDRIRELIAARPASNSG
jgi:FixJ family two-component response regulator